MRILLVGLLFILMLALQQIHNHTDLGTRAALVFGFLLLSGFLLGEVLSKFVPRITGYLLAGMACGPHLLNIVDAQVVSHFSLLNQLALVLIAYTAGGELKIKRLLGRIKGIATITLVQSIVVFGSSSLFLYFLQDHLALFSSLSNGQILGIALVLGVIATATSPATAVAVIVETRAAGAITDTILGVTVLKDILVLIAFSVVLSATLGQFPLDANPAQANLGGLLLKVFLSLLIGVAFGGLMILYLHSVQKQTVLFVIGSAFLLISVSHTFHLDELLMAVASGFVVGNFSRQGNLFLNGLERASGPVFLIFFCLAGAAMNLLVLISDWHLILLLVFVRALTTWVGTWLGSVVANEVETVRRHAWTGFIGQAGISLGLAAMVRTQFPHIGPGIADLIIGGIVINQIAGPIAFRWTLLHTKEAARGPSV
jgi:Kef-type K+ transport system membrane component KefB